MLFYAINISFSGLGYDHIKVRLPHDIDVACRNSPTSCTISGPVESINTFVEQLISEGIFAKAVNVSGIAYHGRYIQKAGPTLLKYLKEVSLKKKLQFLIIRKTINHA